ncbi:MAG: VanZ family protein [Chitinophagaceae bacterium]
MFSSLIQLCRKLIVPLGWTVFTQVLLCLPGTLFEGSGMLNIPHLDKFAHLILFGGLSLFWNLFFHFRKKSFSIHPFLLVFLMASAYGIAIEFFQLYFIPNRSFDVGDIVADICGALCGYFATIIILRSKFVTKN